MKTTGEQKEKHRNTTGTLRKTKGKEEENRSQIISYSKESIATQ